MELIGKNDLQPATSKTKKNKQAITSNKQKT